MKISDERLREGLRFLTLPAAEKVERTRSAFLSAVEVPAFLDDDVMNELRERKFTAYRMLPVGQECEPGDMIAHRDGRLHIGEITSLGRMWLEMRSN